MRATVRPLLCAGCVEEGMAAWPARAISPSGKERPGARRAGTSERWHCTVYREPSPACLRLLSFFACGVANIQIFLYIYLLRAIG